MDRLITVTGHAEVKKEPELAYLNLTMQAKAADGKTAQVDLQSIVGPVLDTLFVLAIDKKAIKTQRFTIQQAHKYDQKKGNLPDGFIASQSISVTVDAADATEVIAAMSEYELQINVGFGLKDHDAETNEALCLAIANAKQKASAMATACGTELGDVISCQEGGGHRGGGGLRMMAASMSSEEGGGRPELPMGEIEINAMVTMQFTLEERGGEVPA